MNRFVPALSPQAIGLTADSFIEEELRGEVNRLVWYRSDSPVETTNPFEFRHGKVFETEFLPENKPSRHTSYLPNGMVGQQDTWIYQKNGDIRVAMADGQGADLGAREIREIEPGLREIRTLGVKDELKELLTIQHDVNGRVIHSHLLDVVQHTRVSLAAAYPSRNAVDATLHYEGGPLDGHVIRLRNSGEQTTVHFYNHEGTLIAEVAQDGYDDSRARRLQTRRDLDGPKIGLPSVQRVTGRDLRGNWTSKTVSFNGAVMAVWERTISYY